MRNLLKYIFVLFTLGIGQAAYAQLPPTNTYGIDLAANNQQTIAGTGHLRLRYNTATGQLEQSVSGGAYYSATNPVGVYNVRSYGAVCNGTNDDTTAFAATFAAAPVGSTVIIPAGNCLLTSTVTVSKGGTHVVGTGIETTKITFNPTVTATAIKFSAGASELGGCSIEGIEFTSVAGNTQTKTAVELDDTTGFVVRNIWVAAFSPDTWTGGTGLNGSIGILFAGREQTEVQFIRIQADRPVVIADDVNTSSIVDNDHLHIFDAFMDATNGGGNANIYINDGVIVTNLTLDGFQSSIVDKYGIYWNDTTSSSTSSDVSIQNFRCEQANDATGYCIYINRTASTVNGVYINNDLVSIQQNGIHLAGFHNATISNTTFGETSGTLTDLDIGTNAFDLFLANNYVNANALANFGTMVLDWAAPYLFSAAPMPSTAHYVDAGTAASRGLQVSALISVLSNKIINFGTANTQPLIYDTNNAFNAGNIMYQWNNHGTLATYIDSGGNWVTSAGFTAPSGVNTKIGFLGANLQLGVAANNIQLLSNTVSFGDNTATAKNFVGSQAAADTSGGAFTFSAQAGGVASATGGGTGASMLIRSGAGGNGTASLSPGASGGTTITTGGAGSGGTGNANSGSLVLDVGAAAGTGTAGNVTVCGTSCTNLIFNRAAGKIGFYGATAVVRPTSTGNTATTAAGSTTTVFTNTTFTGGTGATAYTVGDLVLALKQLGLVAP